MLPAFATLVFFAITPVLAKRAAERQGSLPANFWRLVAAALVLGAWSWLRGAVVPATVQPWLLLGGVAGFGVGGIALFVALPRLGATLTNLLVQCGAALAAVIIERIWLGVTVTPLQLLAALATIAGVAVGLMPTALPRLPRSSFRRGLAWAVVSALGQGAGAVISRKAFVVAAALRYNVDPGAAAFVRVLGGLLPAYLALGAIVALRREERIAKSGAWPWIFANALTGPVLGVTCYQWALRAAPATVVQPIVAAAPLLTAPLAILLAGSPAPRASYYAGAALAASGAAVLVLSL
jgi:drug/metabolite transporter (DMT)-like permease